MLNPEQLTEFDNHERVIRLFRPKIGLNGFIAIHRGGPASLGATRLWPYHSETEALEDALRLSHLMSYKSAIAGFPYGGAKATLIMPIDGLPDRQKFFEIYAEEVHALSGKFVTGTDVGLTDDDVRIMKTKTPYVIGTHVDSSYYTAIGILKGMQSALSAVFGSPNLDGISFAIQGLGKVGMNILAMVYPQAKNIWVTDINLDKILEAQKQFPKIKIVATDKISEQPAEVFVPCALSGSLNSNTIPRMQCKIVIGSANNQLATKEDGVRLHQAGILYAPDYIVNSGGFISVTDEFVNGTPDNQRILERLDHIPQTLASIFKESVSNKEAPASIANQITERLILSKSATD